jgi:ribosomal protein S6--L-glutamate ligase
MDKDQAAFILGRREWVALPDLGVHAILAKIDTGARTSALHADAIEVTGPPDAPRVRFILQPIPEQPEIEIACTGAVIDRREVTSSNGDSELRYIIETTISVGGRAWPIEVGLTNREGMTHRMLIGRQAILADTLVDPTSVFLQPKLSPRLYRR